MQFLGTAKTTPPTSFGGIVMFEDTPKSHRTAAPVPVSRILLGHAGRKRQRRRRTQTQGTAKMIPSTTAQLARVLGRAKQQGRLELQRLGKLLQLHTSLWKTRPACTARRWVRSELHPEMVDPVFCGPFFVCWLALHRPLLPCSLRRIRLVPQSGEQAAHIILCYLCLICLCWEHSSSAYRHKVCLCGPCLVNPCGQ